MPARQILRRSAAVAAATLLGGALVGLTAVPAYAADVTDTASLNAAIVADDPLITIMNDFTLTADIALIDHDVEIVGNGHTIDAAGFDAFDVVSASVTIGNLTVSDPGAEAFDFALDSTNSVVLTGVSSADGQYGVYANLDDQSSLVVNGGSHDNHSEAGIYVWDASGEVELSITGTTIEDARYGINIDRIQGTSNATIADVTVTDARYGIVAEGLDEATIDVTGTDIIAGEDYNTGGVGNGLEVQLLNEASATFDGGSVTGDPEGAYFDYGVWSSQQNDSSFVISNTAVTGNGDNLDVQVLEPEGSFSLLGSTVTGARYYGIYLELDGSGLIANTVVDSNGIDNGFSGVSFYTYEGAPLTISNTTISNNGGRGINGSLYNDETSLTIIDSTIADNDDLGAQIYLEDASALTVDSSTLSGNVDGGLWAHVYDDASTVTVVNSTVSGNMPGEEGGWALWAGGGGDGYFELLNSTVTDNTGVVGVGFEYVTARVSHSIVAGNHIDESEGYGEFWIGADDSVEVSAEWSLIGSLTDASAGTGYSFGDGVTIGIPDLGLGPLADNGGPTLTHLPTAGSPALNSGNPDVAGEPEFDQRGSARVSGSAIDIGAVEVEAILPATGVESTGAVCAGGLLLLFGASVLVATRRLRHRSA